MQELLVFFQVAERFANVVLVPCYLLLQVLHLLPHLFAIFFHRLHQRRWHCGLLVEGAVGLNSFQSFLLFGFHGGEGLLVLHLKEMTGRVKRVAEMHLGCAERFVLFEALVQVLNFRAQRRHLCSLLLDFLAI